MEKIIPDYKRIFTDIINEKFPERREEYDHILSKENLSILDVITLNNNLFRIKKDNGVLASNQQYRAYDRKTILRILDYQKEHQCNNSELARHFKLSRNTIIKWRKRFYSFVITK